jgi:hypothetical protein
MIKRAVRERVYLKLAVTGSTGSGKTFGAIGMAKGLSPDGRVCVIDTENNSASYYAGETDEPGRWVFDVISLQAPFSAQRYAEALQAAIEAGYKVIVIDSLTHEWNASGGILDAKSQRDKGGGNSFTNWNDFKQIHNKFVELLLQSPVHIIATLRSKMEYVVEDATDKDGRVKKVPRKIGLAPISSEGMEYEFGIVFDIDRVSHLATATKDRSNLFEGQAINLDKAVGKKLKEWFMSGAEIPPSPQPPPQAALPPPPPQPEYVPDPPPPPPKSAWQTIQAPEKPKQPISQEVNNFVNDVAGPEPTFSGDPDCITSEQYNMLTKWLGHYGLANDKRVFNFLVKTQGIKEVEPGEFLMFNVTKTCFARLEKTFGNPDQTKMFINHISQEQYA